MSYRLLALDVDGTLLDERGELTPGTVEAVQEASSRGVVVVLVTGRGFRQCAPIAERLGLHGPLVIHNGAATVELSGLTVTDRFAYPIADVAGLVAHCRQHDILFYASTAFDVFVEGLDEGKTDLLRRCGLEGTACGDVLALDEPVMKFTVDDRQRSGGWYHLETVQKKWARGCRMHVMHPQASKGEALARLVSALHLAREDVMAIGNSYNDLSMLQYAGFGVAMGNAPWQVKQRCRAETAANRDEGVRRAIAKYILT
ncbi:Cof-type HAD-IIB family hydrolase [Paenibacillus hodogayensis]|uniref:Cof-type HAD-IIB family hydrolase n=1 Tax=Paenibacillus hodogayensis TaxID=279208 RepID=A0ABV5W387_9BACL